MCAVAFSAMAATAETRDRLDFRTASLAACAAAIEAVTVRMCPDVSSRDVSSRDVHVDDSGDDTLDLDTVADALSAPVEALGTLEELALAAAAKYAGDGVPENNGGEVEVGKLEARACAAVGGMIDAARGIAAAAATSRAMHERRAAAKALASPGPPGTPPTTTASAATSPFAAFDRASAATSPFAAFDQPEEKTTIAPQKTTIASRPPPMMTTPQPPDPPPWARHRLGTGSMEPSAARVDAATAREESLTASVERATTPAMQRLSAIEASLSSRRMSMMERIKMFDKG